MACRSFPDVKEKMKGGWRAARQGRILAEKTYNGDKAREWEGRGLDIAARVLPRARPAEKEELAY